MMLPCPTESGPASHSHSHNHAHPNTMQMAPFGNDNPGLRTPPSASSRDREPPGASRYRRCAYLDSPTFQAFADPADPADPPVLVRVDRSRFQGMVGTSPRASARSNRSIDHSYIPSFAQGSPRQDAAAAATSGDSTPANASPPASPGPIDAAAAAAAAAAFDAAALHVFVRLTASVAITTTTD